MASYWLRASGCRVIDAFASEAERVKPAVAGIQAGVLITEINRIKVTTLADYRAALAKAKDRVLVLLKTKDGGSRFVILRVK